MRHETPPGVGTSVARDWGSVPHPVVVLDDDGIVVAISAAAHAVLPEITVGDRLDGTAPAWVVEACRTRTEVVAGQLDGRDFHVQPTTLPDGQIACWLIADTDRSLQLVQDALQRERKHAAFLDEASAVLTVSLNVDRCMEATARMAARHLADAAVVVGPRSGGVLPVFGSDADGTVTQRQALAPLAEHHEEVLKLLNNALLSSGQCGAGAGREQPGQNLLALAERHVGGAAQQDQGAGRNAVAGQRRDHHRAHRPLETLRKQPGRQG